MTPQIRLSKQNLADWKCIREIGEARLNQVVAKAEQLPPAPLRPTELSSLINAALDGNSEHSQVLLRQLLSLHGMRRQLGLDDKDVFFGLDSGLREAGWEEEELKKWESVSGIFKKLFSLPVVQLSAKALDLSYQHSHLLQRAHIITDIRPIFNSSATEIQGMIISHKFLLRYDDIEGEHILSLAIDEKDIESLITQCTRAITKSNTAQKQLHEKAGLATLIPGKD